jgi:hypothetical protein
MSDVLAELQALAGGDLAAWTGLPAGLTVDDAARALGPASAEASAMIGWQLSSFVTFAATPAAPHGIRAWTRLHDVWLLEIQDPELRAPAAEQLGTPDATDRSGLGGSYRQDVYGARGLVVHVSNITDAVRRLYAIAPAPAAEILDGPLGRIEERRVPRV